MRFCLLLILLLWAASAGHAQTSISPQLSLPANPAAALAASPDAGAVLLFNGWYLPRYQPRAGVADTTGALLSLFRKRRYAGWLYSVPLIAGLSLTFPLSSTDRYGQTHVADEAISPPLGVVVLVGTVAGFIAHAAKFNKAHLLATAKAYVAGQPVPAKYRSQLNDRHFAEAAYLREVLRQQMGPEQPVRP
ncbi:hypothetical protein [Hymenobacter psychrophilus]|uniref:Uncharacterized protein n=1 Tax=Hymenobacter psychrophilus TaxID=651662 RepID=A0A1H3KGR8_9BACT|nr:hypothetical protein [Hymenobacter psychrophilus]SDY51323.1 hypothetical protein SAMN04488069_109128 [Hymenobacter psychrophilus]